jgi:peptidoglycan hydrolase-like protein with peptidoglycan-binding domain
MLQVMKCAALLQKLEHLDALALSARDVMTMATIEGARALRLDNDLGSLEPGKRADLVRFSGSGVRLAYIHDPYQQLVYGASPQDAADVWVDGRRVVADGRLCGIDEGSIVAEAREAAREMGLQSVRGVGLLADIQIAHGTIPAHVRTRRSWPNYQTASERHRIDIIVDAYGNSPWFERHRNVAGGLPLDAYPFDGPHVRSHVAVGVPVVPERIEVSGPVPIARIEGEEIPEAAPHPTLRPGDYGNDVSLLQRLLADRGFMREEEIDGILRDATEAALRTFQKQNRLTEDGMAGPETWAALSPVLEPGDRGPAVKKLQAALNEVEDADLDVDGIFGRETRRAVRAVQRESGIPADGVVGPETRRHLEADLTYDTWPALGPGMQGPEVETLQQFLADRRLLTPGDVDGDFGPATERAIRTLQDGLGLNVDGYTDESVWKALVFEVSLGDRGPVVRALQRELNDKWNADLRIDGVFNHETDRAVRSFQLAHKLKVDGVAGALTWRRLISYIPEPAPFIQPGEQPQPQL